MKNLIDTDSPTYLRRLVRELNSLLRSAKPVYFHHAAFDTPARVYTVCFHELGQKILVQCGIWGTPIELYQSHPQHIFTSEGAEVVASREAK
jgi:hypothetical protein